MSKSFVVDRVNGDKPLENDSVVTVYDSIDDAELDLANIEEGQIVGTNDNVGIEAIEDSIKADIDEYAENLMQSYGQAVGSYLTMEDNSVTPQGYLLADGRDTTGTEDELLTKYPLLYAYLGNTNVLPLEYGLQNNTPEYISTELADKTASDPYIVPHDGTIYVYGRSVNGGSVFRANLNGNWIGSVYGWGTPTGIESGLTINVKKGDAIYIYGATTGRIGTPNISTGETNDNKWYATAIWKKPIYKYIKAVSGIETASTEASEVANAVNTIKAYVSNAEVYSTTEVKTNKTWIDNKPIYRIVITATAGVGPSAWGWAISQADFNNIGIENITFAGVVADGLQFMPVAVHKSNGFFPMVGMILVGQRIVLEYTKA
jgi:hypothetical protein